MKTVVFTICALMLVGCANKSSLETSKAKVIADALAAYGRSEESATAAYDLAAAKAGFERIEIRTAKFVLVARMKSQVPTGSKLEIAIGGDVTPISVTNSAGVTEWVNVARAATATENGFFPDAARDRDIVILERPCYAVTSKQDPNCLDLKWTMQDRMSADIIAAMSQAIDAVKTRRGKSDVHLLGVSAGGSIAILVAAERSDISSIKTLNAPFDFPLVDAQQKRVMAAITAASGIRSTAKDGESHMCSSPCVDPILRVREVRSIPQVHYFGSLDVMVPPANAEAYRRRLSSNCARFIQVAMSHDDEQAVKLWRRGIDDDPPRCG